MGDDRGKPIMPVPKDLSREELALAFRVIEALRSLRFGSVQLLVHDGKVVQIDVAEKLRLREPPRAGGSQAPRSPDGRGTKEEAT